MERIIVENVSKKFNVGFKKNRSALEIFVSVLAWRGREPQKNLEALKDISFSVRAGEVLGVIGSNGCGKSTLLRTIAKIYKPNSGKIILNGKIISLINLYIGMKERLTMKDNIYFCCSLFGVGAPEIGKKFNSIIGFSGLENFVETKLYQFSSGMLQRLAFSIAIHCNPDILLLDEFFEIGDEDFRQKSSDKINELVKNGASVIIVSHELGRLEKYCDRIIWIDEGKVKMIGSPTDIINGYRINSQ